MNTYVREPVNAFTHLGGAILSFIALLAMLVKVSIKMPSFAAITAVILFGIGMMVLYTASAVYHSVVANNRVTEVNEISSLEDTKLEKFLLLT
ncbi:hemolysin III family protein, partial [Bacillus thuringiensis]|nr:hemolysin III family protein [Bacillus thuringiensis]